ncbi:MAG: enoyl-CoA hydratase/isomerase family protein [Mesorhizobium sp.]|nr:MAG: enoyl-CoA hydratase/isomerase family protein [Mesorhizobium sp.]
MSSFRFEQHGAVGKLILLGDADSEPGSDFPSSLRAAVRQAYANDIRILHLTSASGNIAVADDLGAIGDKGSKFLEAFAADILASIRLIEELPVPTVASVAGMALGGGFELLLAFDFLVVAESAMLVLPEVSVGCIPMAGGVQRLADRVGKTLATRFVLLSEPIFGKIAVDLGIATHSAPDGKLEEISDELVRHLATGPTLAYGKARTLIHTWATGGVAAADIISTRLGAGILDTKDGAEGMAIAVAAVRKHEPIPKIQFAGK